jgi:hypothetical protein
MDILSSQMARHHVLDCCLFPVNCPVCGEAQIKRQDINGHVNKITGDCPMVVVPCIFSNIGCMDQVQRANMKKHCNEFSKAHLELLTTKMIDIELKSKIELEEHEKKVQNLIKTLETKTERIEKQNEFLKKEIKDYKANRNSNHNR